MMSVKEKEKKAFEELKDKYHYKNKLAAPRLVKVIVNCGIGSVLKKDAKRKDFIVDRLAKITGQKPAYRQARKSIAGFKVKKGDIVGLIVTLRREKMYSFLDKLFNIALPRTKDFRGIPLKSVDSMGNLTIGIKEHTIFPETTNEDIRDIFGMDITIVTSSRKREEAIDFFKIIGVPFQK